MEKEIEVKKRKGLLMDHLLFVLIEKRTRLIDTQS